MKKLSIFFACVLLFSLSSHAQIIKTVVGNSGSGYNGDGIAATASWLNYPADVVTDATGNIYVADRDNNRIRKINTSGIISTIAGTGVSGYSGDGGDATAAKLNNPKGVAVDILGNVYIADNGNHRVRIINTSGIISTIAGTGTAGYNGDGGVATLAQLNSPTDVVIDTAGNIYIADEVNNRIRKITYPGIISTLAGDGTGGFGGDGGAATSANLNLPYGITLDNMGNLYIADLFNNRVRKINTSGIINTIAGIDTAGFSGDGGPATNAKLNCPLGVATDTLGNVFISDNSNHSIRKVNSAGIISTIAGRDTLGFSGDGGAPTAAKLNLPNGIYVDAASNVFIADLGNNRIRKIYPCFSVPSAGVITGPDTVSVCIDTIIVLSDAVSGGTWMATNSHATVSSTGVVTAHSIGLDTIMYFVSNVCGSDTAKHTVYVKYCTVSLPSFTPSNNAIQIYPNPTSGVVNIEVPGSESNTEITMFDIYGKAVSTQKITGNYAQKVVFDLGKYPKGNYFVKVLSGNTLVWEKVVVW